jgi:hypothetical protein
MAVLAMTGNQQQSLIVVAQNMIHNMPFTDDPHVHFTFPEI